MANEFIARKGLIVSGSTNVSGSVTAHNFTGSLFGTASISATASLAEGIDVIFAGNYETGNDVPYTQQWSMVSASYATTASYALAATAELPNGVISSSTQIINYNTFATTGSNNFIGNQTITGSLTISGSSTFTNIGPAVFSGSISLPNGITGSLQGTSSWTNAVSYTNIANTPNGLVSSSTQTIANIAGQTIAPSTISASNIQVTGTSTVGGNLTVTGTLIATSQSIQYISSSRLDVATNRIIVNTDNSLRFGGITVIDSGSVGKSGSLYWDSLNDRWLYEDVSGGAYNSAILIAGPKNIGATGNERGLITGRIPVASGDDHIDTAPASSSIYVDFPSLLTHVEHGLYVTGSVSATSYTGSFSGSFTGLINSSSYVVPAGLPSGLISSSTQIVTLGTIRLTVGTSRANASAFYFNSNVRLAGDSSAPTADTAFLISSTGLSTVTVYLRQGDAGPNATVVGIAKNANGSAFSGATLITSSSLNLTQDTIQTYTFSGLTLNQFDAIHIYCDPTNTPGVMFGVVVVS